MRIFTDAGIQTGTDTSAQTGDAAGWIRANLAAVESVVVFASAKGGAGKSMLTVNIAVSLALKGRKVAIVDADLNAPSIASMLGMKPPRHLPLTEGIQPVAGPFGLRVVSSEMLPGGEPPPISFLETESPEPVRPADDGRCTELGYSNALARMLSQARFGALDVLLIDVAPGLDRMHEVLRTLPMSGIVLMSHPTDHAVRHARRALEVAAAQKARVIGIVENMIGFNCDSCRSVRPLMPEGGMAALAGEFNVAVLGRLPFDPRIAEASDRGVAIVHEAAETPVAKLLAGVANEIDQCASLRQQTASAPA